MSRPAAAKQRLKAFMDEHRGECREYTLAEIGLAIGVTRERVRQMMPSYGALRLAAKFAEIDRRLSTYLEANPSAILPRHYGGQSFKQITAGTGIRIGDIRPAWARLGLPDRQKLRLMDGYGVPARTNEYNRRHQSEIVGAGVCVNCGADVPLSRTKFRALRERRMRRLVCGISCGMQASRRGLPLWAGGRAMTICGGD